MAKQVAIHDLHPGMFIVGVIEQNGPVKIRKSGLVTSQEMVQGLSEMGVLSVAIDPEKTVEIEVEDSVHVSQTQFVMQANQEKASDDTDNHLAEQFNRSLFMPSLQKVPSVWQYYGSKVAVAVVVVTLGFTGGWFASSVPILFHSTFNKNNNSANVTQDSSNHNNTIATPQSSEVDAKPLADNTSDEAVKSLLGSASVDPQINTESATPGASTNPNVRVLSAAQKSENIPDTQSQFETSLTDTVNRQTTNQNADGTPEEAASLELLKRFEAAMADIERESSPEYADDGETLEYGDPDNGFNSTDVQRVDQLPARVMSRLPRMSFSAHMYASNPGNRWVKVNGVERGEGEWLDEKVFIEKIEPQHVILLFDGHEFSMRALSEW